jgi:hypothetical protein
MENDHECDQLGHTPGSAAMTALDDILNTEHTRTKASETVRKLPPRRGDAATIKKEALAFYRRANRCG